MFCISPIDKSAQAKEKGTGALAFKNKATPIFIPSL
jgi:hypothetical protein